MLAMDRCGEELWEALALIVSFSLGPKGAINGAAGARLWLV